MENKLALEYGPREAAILEDLVQKRKMPSKNEAFRRGLLALDYLDKVDKSVILKMLAKHLDQTASNVKDVTAFSNELAFSRALAYEIVATFASQKGVQGADNIDIFRSTLDDCFVLLSSDGLKGANKDKLTKRLLALSVMAEQFSEKEAKQIEVNRFGPHEKGKTFSS